MYIGADYYPEHWPKERWPQDAADMEKAHFNVTRLAEFSWCKMEPSEGRYNFSWLDEAIDELGRHGVKVILCTPTATMPKWLYDKYPDVSAKEKNGQRMPFGNRQHNCFSSGSYRLMSQRIVRKMAEHFKDNPYVIGWQLDNELWGPYCYCDTCENAFRDYLQKKYGTIENLNREYGTIFWGQCYRHFGEVHLPRHESSNPSLDLDYRRFHSDNIISFAREQVEILREVCPNHFITHNMMGFAENVDYYKFGELLDFVSYDYYYNYGNDSTWKNRIPNYLGGAADLDYMRSVKHCGFWIMENSAGATGWEKYGRNVRPGEIRRMSYQNLARGADGQIWFRWRTSRYGTEQYWHGLINHDGIPARRYQEAKQTASELHRIHQEVQGTTVNAEVAIVIDYNDRWAYSLQQNSEEFYFTYNANMFHTICMERGINVEYVKPEDELEQYKVVILPAKYIVTKEYAEKLERYVAQGGILLTSYRSGVKNEINVPHELVLPGYLRKLTGVRVEEYETVPTQFPYRILMDGEEMDGAVLCDWVIPETATVLAEYREPGLENYAALTENRFGEGKAYYIGIQSKTLLQKLMAKVIEEAGIRHFGQLPQGIEIIVRSDKRQECVFILNHTDTPYTIEINGYDIVAEQSCNGTITVPANDVAVVKRRK